MRDPLLLFGLKKKRELKKKKKENAGFVLAGELEPQGMLGKPQLGLPSSSARRDAPAGWQKGLLSPRLSTTEHKVKPSPGPQELCGKRDFCWEAAAHGQGGGCLRQVSNGAHWERKPVQVALGDQHSPHCLLQPTP